VERYGKAWVCARGRGCGCEFAGARSALNVSICESEVTPSDAGRVCTMHVACVCISSIAVLAGIEHNWLE